MTIAAKEDQLNELMNLCRKILDDHTSDRGLEDTETELPYHLSGGIEGNESLFRKLIPILLKIAFVTSILFSIYEVIKQLIFADLILWQSHLITIVFAGLMASFGAYFPLRKIEVLYQKSMRELTARKKAQAVLKESEERYRQLFELESDALFLIDEKTDRILEVNAAGERLYGFSREEFLSMKSKELIDTSANASLKALLQESPDDFIFHLRKDGSVFPVGISFSRVDWYGKKVRLAAVRDITERLNAHHRIERHRTFLRNVIDANPNFIYVIDKESRFVLANRIFAETLGMSPEQLIGKKFDEISQYFDIAKIIQKDEIAILSSHHHTRIEREENFKDALGNTRWILSIRVPLVNDEGEIDQLIGVSMDITQRKQAEDDLRAREAELEMKSKNLEEVNTALKVLLKQREEDKKEMQEMFLTNVKDQVIPYVQKLKKSGPNAEQKACIETMETHLNDIISPFLTNIASKYIDLTPKEIQVASLIKDGKTTKEIGLLLNISPGSVDLHRYHIRRKMGINKQDVNLRSYLLSLP